MKVTTIEEGGQKLNLVTISPLHSFMHCSRGIFWDFAWIRPAFQETCLE
jgi:hypothetical protein